jgi:hypothetical protein
MAASYVSTFDPSSLRSASPSYGAAKADLPAAYRHNYRFQELSSPSDYDQKLRNDDHRPASHASSTATCPSAFTEHEPGVDVFYQQTAWQADLPDTTNEKSSNGKPGVTPLIYC